MVNNVIFLKAIGPMWFNSMLIIFIDNNYCYCRDQYNVISIDVKYIIRRAFCSIGCASFEFRRRVRVLDCVVVRTCLR